MASYASFIAQDVQSLRYSCSIPNAFYSLLFGRIFGDWSNRVVMIAKIKANKKTVRRNLILVSKIEL